MSSSYVDYCGRGFWSNDAPLEVTLGLLVVELQELATEDSEVDEVLDDWTLQSVVGFSGCVSPDFDEALAIDALARVMPVAIGRAVANLPSADRTVVQGADFDRRVGRVTAGGPWSRPTAVTAWARQVLIATGALVGGNLPEPRGDWFVFDDGLHDLIRSRDGR